MPWDGLDRRADGERIAALEVGVRHLREAQVATKAELRADIAGVRTGIEAIQRDVQTLMQRDAARRSSERTARGILSLCAGTFGAAVTAVVHYLIGGPK